VDYATEDTFLFACMTNISELGIFVQTRQPHEIGTRLRLRFREPAGELFELNGTVQWINPVRPLSDNRNPGMGVTFVGLTQQARLRIVELVKTIAFVRDSAN
jgi:type IV pilus assembly protein PilZ